MYQVLWSVLGNGTSILSAMKPRGLVSGKSVKIACGGIDSVLYTTLAFGICGVNVTGYMCPVLCAIQCVVYMSLSYVSRNRGTMC